MVDETEEEFVRRWSERVYDVSQLAALASIHEQLLHFAQHAWRPLAFQPPQDTMLICACDEGLVLMTLTRMGDWRTSQGQPHRPPCAWMPAPVLPIRAIDGDVP